jgi:Clp amino terminal domain, pathogenicity island component
LATPQRVRELAAAATEAPSPLEALRRLTELRQVLDEFERLQVSRALSEGATFTMIARDIGVSRQAAHRRFRDLAVTEPALRTTEDARRVIRYIREEGLANGADAPASEHVVLAVLRAADLPASAVLRNAGATLERARTQVGGASPRTPLFKRRQGAGDLRELLAAAADEARKRKGRAIEPEHLLLGALRDDAGGAARTVRALGVSVEGVRDALSALLESRGG